MRITLNQVVGLLILTGVSLVGTSNAQEILDKQVTLDITRQPLKEILRKIESKAEVKFAYSRDAISSKDKISIKVDDEKLRDVLDQLLKPRQIQYEVIGKQIILKIQHHRKNDGAMLEFEIVDQFMFGIIRQNKVSLFPGFTSSAAAATSEALIARAHSTRLPQG